ncbi:hypothetical protein [Biostraticola tofi]|uniref:Uncharacterized protein n=1 Tax=Biostraticola tofi TaxID=466109 RepID=A0A4R3Z374_9GAMM|nr:hypothetical protein [Biostraticola tofi]TCV98303.1 hypothetical protein EDC52_103395 [Biostraticola tofi]
MFLTPLLSAVAVMLMTLSLQAMANSHVGTAIGRFQAADIPPRLDAESCSGKMYDNARIEWVNPVFRPGLALFAIRSSLTGVDAFTVPLSAPDYRILLAQVAKQNQKIDFCLSSVLTLESYRFRH